MKITPMFAWYDLWIGVYIDRKRRATLCDNGRTDILEGEKEMQSSAYFVATRVRR